ncbi:MAG: response regulator transcription factor [Opitutales bacterium]|nr:response regulator transcription factor [Opitutales bacterium]
MKNRISIVLAEDHLIVREGIRNLLQGEDDFAVVGEVTNGREAIEKVAELRPDVVVMDIALPLLNGIEACRHFHKAHSKSRVLMLSAHGDDAYVEGSIEAGAAGFVLKQAPGSALAHAIREVHAGRRFFSAAILQRYRDVQSGLRDGSGPKKRPPLTPREAEVLQLIAEGKANKETAVELGISIKTVEKHRTNLMRKLNIHDTATLTRYAIAEGIIESRIQNTTG